MCLDAVGGLQMILHLTKGFVPPLFMKLCTKCNTPKDCTNFSECCYNADGLANWCKECNKQYKKQYRKQNKLKISAYGKQYYSCNKTKIQAYKKQYSLKNKDKMNVYYKNRLSSNVLYATMHRMRNMVNRALKKQGLSKSKRTVEILGADFSVVFEHLVQTAVKNYGFFTGNIKDYHIDHIKPISTAINKEQVLELSNYKNLQLLYPKDNLTKGCKSA